MTSANAGALTLERGLELLEQVAGGVDRLDELAAVTGLSRSSAHRMLTSFVKRQYLTLGDDKRYRLGVKLLDLGGRAERALNLPGEVQEVLAGLSNESSDASHLGILVDDDILYLAKARGHRGIDMASRPGTRFRAQHTAMGKILLAYQPSEAVDRLFDPASAQTERSIRSLEAFRRVVEEAKQRGYAIDDQENEPGITCVAVAIPDLGGAMAAAISISAPSVYMTAERIEELVRLIRSRQPRITAFLPPDFARHWL